MKKKYYYSIILFVQEGSNRYKKLKLRENQR